MFTEVSVPPLGRGWVHRAWVLSHQVLSNQMLSWGGEREVSKPSDPNLFPPPGRSCLEGGEREGHPNHMTQPSPPPGRRG